jgi:CHAT domain-containing protein/tetratricopeptide (TPR) repeat protein
MPPTLRFLVSILVPVAMAVEAAGQDLDELLERGDWEGAETLLEELAADWEEAWREDPGGEAGLELGRTLQALGVIERQTGKPEEALEHLGRAVELLVDVPAVERADVLEAQAMTLQDQGDSATAEGILREVLGLREGLPEDQREPALALTRDHLASALLGAGKYPEAGELFRANLAATPGDEPVNRARRHGNLGRYWHTLGSHARALAEFEQALKLLGSAGEEESELSLALASQLALAELRLGRAEEARRRFEDAADDARRLYAEPGQQFHAAPYFNNLGALALAEGDAAQAKESFEEALSMLETSLGDGHPALIAPLNNLGCACQAAGDYDQARRHLQRAIVLQETHLPRLHLRSAETARNLAANALLAGEEDAGRLIRWATDTGVELLAELVRHGSQRARLNFLQRIDLMSLPCATGDGRLVADVLVATKARLLGTMLGETSESADAGPGWRDVQASLKPGMALVDCCRFTTIGPEPVERYGAAVLLPEGDPVWVELGSEVSLQYWLQAFRERLAWRSAVLSGEEMNPPVMRLRAILRELHREFWEPIDAVLPEGTQDIAFAPDGALYFLPLSVLLNEEGELLCQGRRQVVTLTSARDLLDDPPDQSLAETGWALIGVDEYPQPETPPTGSALAEVLAELSPMPGVRDELDRLRRVAPRRTMVKIGEEANEQAVRALDERPGVLHLGSHAFFLHEKQAVAGAVLDFDERSDLLLSGGLLLRRAAMRDPDAPPTAMDDDLLYPVEVATLPLQDTRLVTLSSCESGAGTMVSGEGLLGLRRGFTLAGAREVVVALWPVSDKAAPEFMERFYRLAIASDRPAQALWQAQREMIGPAEASGDDDEFEFAVLRHAPFVLSQHGPLLRGPEIEPAPMRWQVPWWQLAWAIPLVLFLAARWWARRRAARDAS